MIMSFLLLFFCVYLQRWDTMDIFMQHDVQELSRVVSPLRACDITDMYVHVWHVTEHACLGPFIRLGLVLWCFLCSFFMCFLCCYAVVGQH